MMKSGEGQMLENVHHVLLQVARKSRGSFRVDEIVGQRIRKGVHSDMEAKVRVHGRRALVVFEVLHDPKETTAKDAAAKVMGITRQANHGGQRVYGVVVGEAIPASLITYIDGLDISYLSLGGETCLRFTDFFFFDRSSEAGSAHRPILSLDKVFVGKAACAADVLLADPSAVWRINRLSDKCGMSVSVGHKLKARLLHLGIVALVKGKAFGLTQEGRRALREWKRGAQAPTVVDRH